MDEREKIAEHVNRTAQITEDPCPHCGNTNTSVAEDLFRLGVGTKTLPSAFVPVVPVICSNCGFLRIFSAWALGIVLPQAEEG